MAIFEDFDNLGRVSTDLEEYHHPIVEDEKPKSEEYQNSIRYPNKQFYAEYYAICDRLDKFVNEISVAMITDFVNRNRHVLDKEWVKPKQAKNTGK